MPFFLNVVFLKSVENDKAPSTPLSTGSSQGSIGSMRSNSGINPFHAEEDATPAVRSASSRDSLAQLRRNLVQRKLAKGWGEIAAGGLRVVPCGRQTSSDLGKAFVNHLRNAVQEQGAQVSFELVEQNEAMLTYKVTAEVADLSEATSHAAGEMGLVKGMGRFGDRAARAVGNVTGKTAGMVGKVVGGDLTKRFDAMQEKNLRRAWNRSLSGLVQGQEGVQVVAIANSEDYQLRWMPQFLHKLELSRLHWMMSGGDVVMNALEDEEYARKAKAVGLLRPYVLLACMAPQNRAVVAAGLGIVDSREASNDSPSAEAWALLSSFDGISMRVMGVSETLGKMVGTTRLLSWYEILERLMRAANLPMPQEVREASTAAAVLNSGAGSVLPMSVGNAANAASSLSARVQNQVQALGSGPDQDSETRMAVAENMAAVLAMERVVLLTLQENCIAALPEEGQSKVLAAAAIVERQLLANTPCAGLGPLAVVCGAQDASLASLTLNTIKRLAPGMAAAVGAGFFFGPLGMIGARAMHTAYLKLGGNPISAAAAVQDICLERLRLQLKGCSLDDAHAVMAGRPDV
mmetsp:Transcript_43689/g.103117  ORF Transcript_43689/g.103117 Transcript_43689/m.103117 type:complete len:576 (+) Transcript_43689:79-1806(+)